MGKLRDVWNRSAYEIRGMLQKYPFTVAAVGMWTILEIIFLESEQMEIKHLLLPFFVYAGIGFFFSETLAMGKSCKNSYIDGGIPAACIWKIYGRKRKPFGRCVVCPHKNRVYSCPFNLWSLHVLAAVKAVAAAVYAEGIF